MVKRKDEEESWEKDELAVPLPIQIFLWRQSSPFIRPRLGKLHEATCMFCQKIPSHHEIKEASKSLEKVLVQNILHGLSPPLTDAIRSVPRWRFVQAAFPHVMHCAATLLYNRRDSTIMNLGAVESKLLYTLHWILLDAAEECADADTEKNVHKDHKDTSYYLFSVSSVQVFIYMFAPILLTLKESDFQNFRLENGLKIWNALWEFRHPDVPVFTTPVRPKRVIMRGKRVRRSTTQFGDVFLGSGKPQSPDDDNVFFLGGYNEGSAGRSPRASASSPHELLGSVSSQDSRNLEAAKLEEDLRLIGGNREASFPETIPEETSSTEEEHVVIFRLGSYPDTDGLRESQVYKAEHPSSFLRPPMVEVSDVNGHVCTQIQSPTKPSSISGSTHTDSQSPRPCGGMSPMKTSSISSGGRASPLGDPTLATIMDVSVLRCLFVHQWIEEGVFWALTFIYRRTQRMQEIGHEVNLKEEPRKRSNSLPVPKIHVSLHTDADGKSKDQEVTDDPSSSDPNYASETKFLSEGRRESGESVRKKKKIRDLKAFVETKLRSRSERALEKIGIDDSVRSSISEVQGGDGEHPWKIERPHSALEKLDEHRISSGPLAPFPMAPGLIKGKSMPSLRFVGATQQDTSAAKKIIAASSAVAEPTPPLPPILREPTPPEAVQERVSAKVKKPIITVTQHTPSPSEHGWKDQVGLSSVLATCAGHIPFMVNMHCCLHSHSCYY